MADLHLHLHDAESLQVVARSIDPNPVSEFLGGTDVPTEILHHVARAGESYCVSVYWDTESYSQPVAPSWIQLLSLTGDKNRLTYRTYRSIGNPAESRNPGLLAVGATAHSDNHTIQPYSSRGPTPDGRIKPDIVGVDEASLSSLESFQGTSQASPHVAGLAALVLDAWPHYDPQQVARYLKAHAVDRGLPGPDFDWGYGLAYLPRIDFVAQLADDRASLERLARLFGATEGSATYTATSGNPEVLTATVRKGALLLTPVEGTEGRVLIRVTARFGDGSTRTVRIVVTVTSTLLRPGFISGWRAVLLQE